MALKVEPPAALQQDWLAAFVGLVKDRFGHLVADRRQSAFWRAVLEACLACGETSLERYFLRLSSEPLDSPAVSELVSRFTIKESYFFRDEQLVSVLRALVMPLLIERASARRLSIWSAGCAQGEEAYTLSILLQELTVGRQDFEFEIVATDLDEAGLARARAAEYSEWSVRSLSAEHRDRYFERRGARFVLRQRWRRNVRFDTHNLVDPLARPPSPGAFDLVLCRNVAIYFTEPALVTLNEKLAQGLGAQGLLLLAPSDPRPANDAELLPLVLRHAGRAVIAYARPGSTWPNQRPAEPRPLPEPQSLPSEPPPRPTTRPPQRALAPSTIPAPSNRHAIELEVKKRVEAAYREASAGGLELALVTARAAIEFAPLHAAPYFALAVFEIEQGRHDEAEALLRRALYLEPELAEAHYRLGLLCQRRGDAPAARRCFFNALRSEQARGDTSSALAAAIGAQLAHLERAP